MATVRIALSLPAELLDELIDQHGEPSSADYAWARHALGLE
jgi:hypothetical protein